MTRHALVALVAAGMALGVVPSHVLAQAAIYLDAGAAFPTGDWGIPDGGAGGFGATPGFLASGGIDVPVGTGGFSLGVRVLHGSFPYDNNDIRDETSGLLAGTVTATLASGPTSGIFGYLEAGLLRHSFESNVSPDRTDTGGIVGGGLGVRIPLGGGLGASLALRYSDSLIDGDYAQFIGITGGMRFLLR